MRVIVRRLQRRGLPLECRADEIGDALGASEPRAVTAGYDVELGVGDELGCSLADLGSAERIALAPHDLDVDP
jgi:hypothetical protein